MSHFVTSPLAFSTKIKKYAEEAERPAETIRNWVWPRTSHTVKNNSKDKPAEIQQPKYSYHARKKTKVYSSRDNSQAQLQSLVPGSEVAEIPPTKSGDGAGKVIPLKPDQEIISDAMRLAGMAIGHLRYIHPDDPRRLEALQGVEKWIVEIKGTPNKEKIICLVSRTFSYERRRGHTGRENHSSGRRTSRRRAHIQA